MHIIGILLISPKKYFNNPYIKGAGIYPTKLYNICALPFPKVFRSFGHALIIIPVAIGIIPLPKNNIINKHPIIVCIELQKGNIILNNIANIPENIIYLIANIF